LVPIRSDIFRAIFLDGMNSNDKLANTIIERNENMNPQKVQSFLMKNI